MIAIGDKCVGTYAMKCVCDEVYDMYDELRYILFELIIDWIILNELYYSIEKIPGSLFYHDINYYVEIWPLGSVPVKIDVHGRLNGIEILA